MDSSAASAQPRETDESVLCYNGEIYNCEDLCARLGSPRERASDTIVLQEYLDRYGIEALGDVNGMFAFAYFRKASGELSLARDSLGIKPLYYREDAARVMFASEVLPIVRLTGERATLDLDLLRQQVLFTSTLTCQDRTLLKGIRQLPPGCCWTYRIESNRIVKTARRFTIEQGWHGEPSMHPAARQEHRRSVLADVVARQRQSCTGVGVFLSGGLDSSLLTALLSKGQPGIAVITTRYLNRGAALSSDDLSVSTKLAAELDCCLAYADCELGNERKWDIADIVEPHALSDDIRFAAIWQNYGEASRQGLGVVLNGQGADELYGGYLDRTMWSMLERGAQREAFAHITERRLPEYARSAPYREFIAQFDEELCASYAGSSALSAYLQLHKDRQLRRVLEFEDYYSMQWSVECRVPYLDARSLELASALGQDEFYCASAANSKLALRGVAESELPAYVWGRKKSPFPAAPSEQARAFFDALLERERDAMKRSSLLQEVFRTSDVESTIWRSGCRRSQWNIGVLLAYERKFAEYITS